jgi:hypothetical protein
MVMLPVSLILPLTAVYTSGTISAICVSLVEPAAGSKRQG